MHARQVEHGSIFEWAKFSRMKACTTTTSTTEAQTDLIVMSPGYGFPCAIKRRQSTKKREDRILSLEAPRPLYTMHAASDADGNDGKV